jgi:hypothetical protein
MTGCGHSGHQQTWVFYGWFDVLFRECMGNILGFRVLIEIRKIAGFEVQRKDQGLCEHWHKQ